MPKKPKTSEQAAKAAPTAQPAAAPSTASAQDATAGLTAQDMDPDDLNGETWSDFSEVGDEEDELPER